MIRFMTLFIFIVFVIAPPHTLGADFTKAVLGLKLGMTLDEVKAHYPSLQVRMIRHWGTDEVLFYTATIDSEKINNWIVVSMLFSAYNQGRKLYKLHVEQFVGDDVYETLEKKVLDRFGPPDCDIPFVSGKKLSWGKCPGNGGSEKGGPPGRHLSFIYDNAQISLVMEDEAQAAHIRKQVKIHDEEMRLKEVLELDF